MMYQAGIFLVTIGVGRILSGLMDGDFVTKEYWKAFNSKPGIRIIDISVLILTLIGIAIVFS